MKLKIFVIRDRATDQFSNPLFMVSVGQAIRHFGDEVNRADKDNQFYMHAEDYDMYMLGEYDPSTGMFATGVPERVAMGKDLIIQKQ